MENSKVLKMPERISESETAYLKAALSQVNEAQAVLNFVQRQLAAAYGLSDGDQVTADGVIIRKAK